jgi:hypothetical protein
MIGLLQGQLDSLFDLCLAAGAVAPSHHGVFHKDNIHSGVFHAQLDKQPVLRRRDSCAGKPIGW